MSPDSLTPEQRKALARNIWRILAELWLDQHGMEGTVTIVEKEPAA